MRNDIAAIPTRPIKKLFRLSKQLISMSKPTRNTGTFQAKPFKSLIMICADSVEPTFNEQINTERKEIMPKITEQMLEETKFFTRTGQDTWKGLR